MAADTHCHASMAPMPSRNASTMAAYPTAAKNRSACSCDMILFP
jgi:hypothetical protein